MNVGGIGGEWSGVGSSRSCRQFGCYVSGGSANERANERARKLTRVFGFAGIRPSSLNLGVLSIVELPYESPPTDAPLARSPFETITFRHSTRIRILVLVNGILRSEHEMRLLFDEKLEHLLGSTVFGAFAGARRCCRSAVGNFAAFEAWKTEERSGRGRFARRDERWLEDDGEIGGRHEIAIGGAGKDGEKVEEIEEQVARGRREEGDQFAIGGDGIGEGLR